METFLRPVRYRPGSATADDAAAIPSESAGTSSRDFGSRIGITQSACTARRVGDTYNHEHASPMTPGNSPLNTDDAAHSHDDVEDRDGTPENRQVIHNMHRRTALVGGDIRTPTTVRSQILEDGAGLVADAPTPGSQRRSPFGRLWSLFGSGKKKERRSASMRRSFRDYSGSCFSDSHQRDESEFAPTTVRVTPQAHCMTQFLSFDGAWSPPDSTAQISDLNKPLPLSPKDCSQHSRPQQSTKESLLPHTAVRGINVSNNAGSRFLHFTAPTLPISPSSQPLGKTQFESITRDLL
jgi:hypothetical protein